MESPELIPPNRIRFRGQETIVGATVYLALGAIAAAGGRLSKAELCWAVWRERMAGDRRIWSLCHRVNERLGEVGHPGRIGADCGAVLLC